MSEKTVDNRREGRNGGKLKNDAGPGRPKGTLSFKTVLREILNQKIKDIPMSPEVKDKLMAMGITDNLSGYAAAIHGQLIAAIMGNPQAFSKLADYSGEKPKEEVEQKIEVDDKSQAREKLIQYMNDRRARKTNS